MEIYEITGWKTGVDDSGVNFLQPSDSFVNIQDGFINRQVLQSRQGIGYFAPQLDDQSRVMGIFEFIHPDQTVELLAFDKNFLYSFVGGVFVQIPFGGSLAGYTGFNITNNEHYISGTPYPDKDNNPRFVFCGLGITATGAPTNSSIFFYNGTEVLDYLSTAVTDNPDYAPPPGGAFTRAKYVKYFTGRINFVCPVIAFIEQNQSILHSGIRTKLGNGDKFNVPGAGTKVITTSEIITGVTQLGQVLSLNLTRSNWTLEVTADVFNPYFLRKTPSVLGTNADFSAVQWFDCVKSVGKTGFISTDGRRSVRFDDKIHNFTRNVIDSVNFNLTYGGFDRENNQFLWSYPQLEATTQDSVEVYNYEEDSWSTFKMRLSVFGEAGIGESFVWNEIDETAGDISWKRWDTTEDIWNEIGLGDTTQKTLAGDNEGFIYELNKDYDDIFADISDVTPGATTTLTISNSNFHEGDVVSIENVEGMIELNNFDSETNLLTKSLYNVLSATFTSVVIDVDSSLYTAYTLNTGSISKVIQFSAQTIPFNPYRSIGRRVFISHIEFLIGNIGAQLLVSVTQDDEFLLKENVLCAPNQSSTKSREWVTMVVDNEADFMTFILKQSSPAVQLMLYSMRIHCSPGGYTSG